ncbi:mitochondrial FAD carrier protein flx1 [Entomophthora muscae]|uniref:Mitochondrial FAD carrier protein flx1 n=1 Tax=Entomophthora muscae TaxID=34485 RepID=A0ACC2T395_9FUNG|nr:mitochondrial FAD carrier protein flx1 [Entomophthora muscae]
MLASAQAGALTVLCTNPIWVVKTRIFTSSANNPNAYRGLIDGLVKITKLEGISGLYKGLVPALFGTSHGAFQFMAYEELKRWKATRGAASQVGNDKLSTFDYIWMSTFSKVFASVTTYPYQVVKTRLQRLPESALDVKYEGATDTVKKIYRNEGLLGFYKGLGPSIIRVLPGTCITFLVYEKVSGYFRKNASG